MTRPRGITVFSILLGWLAIAGIGNAVVWNVGAVQELWSQMPSSRQLAPPGGALFTLLLLAYAVSAAASSIALWKMRPWAARAYGAWCLVVLASSAWMALKGFAPSLIVGLLFAAGMFGFVSLGYPYIASKIPSGDNYRA